MRLRSLEGRLTILLALAALMGALVYVGVTDWPLPQFIAWFDDAFKQSVKQPDRSEAIVICVVVLLPLSWWLGHLVMEPVKRLLRALEGAVASYRDGDFSISIAINRRDELGDLIRVHNELGQTPESGTTRTIVGYRSSEHAGSTRADRCGRARGIRQHRSQAFIQ
jgi:two-component system nitrogen regulation sensor histidine kinase NtrY